jgi:hypothetical protein
LGGFTSPHQVRGCNPFTLLELVAKLTFEIAMRDDGTSQQHKRFMRGIARLLAHPQLPELMQP